MAEDEVEYELANADSIWQDEEFVKELYRRNEEMQSGKVKGIPAEEVHNNVRAMLNNMKKK